MENNLTAMQFVLWATSIQNFSFECRVTSLLTERAKIEQTLKENTEAYRAFHVTLCAHNNANLEMLKFANSDEEGGEKVSPCKIGQRVLRITQL